MNAILKRAIDAVQALPEAQQAEVAAEMLAFAIMANRDAPGLTAGQIAGVKAAQAEVRRGEFATGAEMDEVWRSFEP